MAPLIELSPESTSMSTSMSGVTRRFSPESDPKADANGSEMLEVDEEVCAGAKKLNDDEVIEDDEAGGTVDGTACQPIGTRDYITTTKLTRHVLTPDTDHAAHAHFSILALQTHARPGTVAPAQRPTLASLGPSLSRLADVRLAGSREPVGVTDTAREPPWSRVVAIGSAATTIVTSRTRRSGDLHHDPVQTRMARALGQSPWPRP